MSDPTEADRGSGRQREARAVEALLREHRQDPAWEPWHQAWGEHVVSLLRERRGDDAPEHLCLAGRFHYPLSSRRTLSQPWTDRIVDRLRGVRPDVAVASSLAMKDLVPLHVRTSLRQQRSVLEQVGYARADAHRIVQLMDGYGLRGDPERRLLNDVAAQALLAEEIAPVPNARRVSWLREWWDSLSRETAEAAQERHPLLRPLPLPEPLLATGFSSRWLGEAVDDQPIEYGPRGRNAGTWSARTVGFPDVRLPILDHGLDLRVASDRVTPAALDAALTVWMRLGADAKRTMAQALGRRRKFLLRSTESEFETHEGILERLVDFESMCIRGPGAQWSGLALSIGFTWVSGPEPDDLLTIDEKGQIACGPPWS